MRTRGRLARIVSRSRRSSREIGIASDCFSFIRPL